MIRQERFSSTMTDLKSASPVNESLMVRLADCRVHVASNSPRLIEILARFCRE